MTEKEEHKLKGQILAHIQDILQRNLDQKLTLELANGIYGSMEVKFSEFNDTPTTKG